MSAAALHARPRAHASLPCQAQLTATAGSCAGPLSPPDALSGALVCWHTHTVLAPALPAARAGGAPRSLGLWPLTWRAATGRGFDVAAQGLPGHWGRRRGDSPRVRGRVDGARWSCACRSIPLLCLVPACPPTPLPAAGCRSWCVCGVSLHACPLDPHLLLFSLGFFRGCLWTGVRAFSAVSPRPET